MSHPFTIVGLGESLFDVFPDRAILGGAPLNVAYHAHQLCSASGGRGVVASRAGTDELGQRLLDELQLRNLSAEFVQIDNAHPTGRVDIALNDGEPTYNFLADVAWDHLEWTPAWRQLAETCDAVVFGTLAQRCPTSRATVQRFVETARQAIRLFDVNLRVTFFDADSLRRGAELATAIKLNADELPVVLQRLGLRADDQHSRDGARCLLQNFEPSGLRSVVITHGEQGTELLIGDTSVRGEIAKFERHPQADNVGAGDACSAGLLWGWLNGWSPEQTVTLANRLGAFVASQPGATPLLPRDIQFDRILSDT
ncbi:MAG: PfkB family carbohydrate kinase [Planctomycetaceae bacterium]